MNHVCSVDYLEDQQVMFSKAWFAYPRMTFRISRSLASSVTLGISFFFVSLNAWAACSGDTVISTNITTQQINGSELCSFTVNTTGTISTSLTGSSGDDISNNGTITTLNNIGSISTSGSDAYGVYNQRTITTLNNTGSISTSNTIAYGIGNSGTITTLNNTGSISTSGSGAYGIGNYGTITTLNNRGSISTAGGSNYGISNSGSITTLNNQQGKSGNNPLTFSGRLPSNYNIIIASSTNYGQLSIFTPSSKMVFSISSLSSTNSSIVGQT